jgi:hypothetical protein
MRTLTIRILGVAPVVVSFLLFGSAPDNSAWANPFQMRLVDQATGKGLAHVRLTSDNGIVCYTRADGSVLWTESALRIATYHFGAKQPVLSAR